MFIIPASTLFDPAFFCADPYGNYQNRPKSREVLCYYLNKRQAYLIAETNTPGLFSLSLLCWMWKTMLSFCGSKNSISAESLVRVSSEDKNPAIANSASTLNGAESWKGSHSCISYNSSWSLQGEKKLINCRIFEFTVFVLASRYFLPDWLLWSRSP